MREAIRQRLLTAIPALDGQAFELHDDVSSVEPPYTVVIQGPETMDKSWMGLQRAFDVWPYAATDDGFEAVDALADAVIAALDGQLLTTVDDNQTFVCRYVGSVNGDALNEEKNALTRGLRFSASGLPLGGTPGSIQEDNWLAALHNWSADWLGSNWAVYLDVWPADFQKPALLWRVAHLSLNDGGLGAYEIRKRIVGHFVGLNRQQELAAVIGLFGRLRSGIKLPLDTEEEAWLKVVDVEADMQADSLTTGQATITLSRRESPASSLAPLMQQISIYPK